MKCSHRLAMTVGRAQRAFLRMYEDARRKNRRVAPTAESIAKQVAFARDSFIAQRERRLAVRFAEAFQRARARVR